MRNEKLHKNIHEKFGFTPTIEQALKMIEKWLEFKQNNDPQQFPTARSIKGDSVSLNIF